MSKRKKIITSYLLHQYPDQVRAEFADWFSSSFDKEEKDSLLVEHWEGIDVPFNKLQTRCSYKSVQEKIHRNEAKVRRATMMRSISHIAAVVVLAVAIFASVKLFTNASHAVKWQEVYVGYGENKVVELSDGSTLTLAPGTRLIYPDSFDTDVRKVYLSGEAYYRAALGIRLAAEYEYYKKNYTQALAYLNVIAKRAYKKDNYYTDATQAGVLAALENEYFLEFPAEGVIWWALIRLDTIWDYNNYLKEQKAKNPNILLWPISNSARQKNYKLTQTPGWN